MVLKCSSWIAILVSEATYLLQARGQGLTDYVKKAYCEEYLDELIVEQQSLSPEPIENIPLKERSLKGGTYNPEDDPLMPFEKRGVNSIESLKDVDRVFYNRVAKCGSRTVMRILEKLEKLNNFTIYKSKVYDKMKLQLEEQVRIPLPWGQIQWNSALADCALTATGTFVRLPEFQLLKMNTRHKPSGEIVLEVVHWVGIIGHAIQTI